MKYTNQYPAIFISRPNRFIATVDIEGTIETVHVKNTGRCRELLIPGVKVMLEKSNNPDRKTKYDLVMVYKENLGWVNIDSQMPNALVREWLESEPEEFSGLTLIKPEYTYGDSRVDFYLERGDEKILIEVKGVTLEIDGIGYFPDAPTERGVKHIRELIKARREGYEAYIAFVIQMNGIKEVRANMNTHREFGVALVEAQKAGVKVLMLECNVSENEIKIHCGGTVHEN
jgi:sugar fermentation stimulation protein A